MTKKPPKTLWVNVYKDDLNAFARKWRALSDKPWTIGCIGTFKYVLDKGKK